MNRRIVIFALLLVGLVIAAFTLPVREWLDALLRWIDANPRGAWLAFAAAYVLACVLLLPGLILTLAAGALFGVVQGTVLVSLASVAGATAAFLIGRTFARDWIRSRVESMRRFKALDRALEQKGFLIVLLTRLSPLFPFNLLNYAYGLTGVKLREYVFGSWIGMFPATVLYVYVGSAAANLAQISRGEVSAGTAGRVLFFAGLVATVVVAILVTRVARQALDRELAAE